MIAFLLYAGIQILAETYGKSANAATHFAVDHINQFIYIHLFLLSPEISLNTISICAMPANKPVISGSCVSRSVLILTVLAVIPLK